MAVDTGQLNNHVCGECGSPLTLIPVQNHPDKTVMECRNRTCRLAGRDQNPRFSRPGVTQVEFGASLFTRRVHGRPSQGEDNCKMVAAAMLESLGPSYRIGQPCPEKGAPRNSRNERGFDFTLHWPCGHEIEVQVVRLSDTRHYADLGRDGRAEDSRTFDEMKGLFDKTISEKTENTPPADRKNRILAIDGTSPEVGFASWYMQLDTPGLRQETQWMAIAVIIDGPNSRFIDGGGLPTCPHCQERPGD